jgi:hypothetical protein
MKKTNLKDTIKRTISSYKKYKLSLGEESAIDTIASDITDELNRKFIIEPAVTWAHKKPSKSDKNASNT